MSKVIIENRTDLGDNTALWYVAQVIAGGRVSDSGKCYCYHTEFIEGIHVSATRNKASDRFIVYRDGGEVAA